MAELKMLPPKMQICAPDGRYKAVVFDMDGTLYDQKRLRLTMAIRLCLYYFCHPFKIRELFVLKTFREVREHWPETDTDAQENIDRLQYERVATKHHVTAELVEKVVERWIYEDPLSALPKYRDDKLAAYIQALREADIPVYIFSDYPAEDKLKALEIAVDDIYAPGDEREVELKPSPHGLLLLMKEHGLTPEEVLLVGDRDEKDGEAARRAGVDCVILSRKVSERQYS